MPLAAPDDLYRERNNPLRVLIVEDEFLIALMAEVELEAAGLIVVGKAATHGMALELARRLRPDLVLMDVRLGGGTDAPDGIDAAIALRRELGIGVIFTTGSKDAANTARAAVAAPLGWVAKPYSGEELIAAIRAATRLLPSAD